VRYIAAADGCDTAKGYDMTAIFRDMMNEMYSVDHSKKVRIVKRNNALQGKALTRLPYGYRIEDDRSVWLIDETAANIVREIFDLFIAGISPSDICRDFTARGIITPEKYRGNKTASDVWSICTIYKMLEDPVYIGTYISGKVTHVYKTKKRVARPEDEWIIIENHHAPIVDFTVFEAVQRRRDTRRRYTKNGERSVMSGLAYCADCGATMSYAASGQSLPNFICKTYRKADCYNRHKCTRHGIRVTALEEYVFKHIKEYIALANNNVAELEQRVYLSSTTETQMAIKAKTSELAKTKRKIENIEKTINDLFKDKSAGKLNEERFYSMLTAFETEQSNLNTTAKTLADELSVLETKTADVSRFIELAKEYKDATEFTETMARLFIDKVYVHEGVFAKGTKGKKLSQEITVRLAFIGQV
jgi:hypothetical protein